MKKDVNDGQHVMLSTTAGWIPVIYCESEDSWITSDDGRILGGDWRWPIRGEWHWPNG